MPHQGSTKYLTRGIVETDIFDPNATRHDVGTPARRQRRPCAS